MIVRVVAGGMVVMALLLSLAHCPVEKTIPAGLVQMRTAADANRGGE